MKKNKVFYLIVNFILMMYMLGNVSIYAAGTMDSKTTTGTTSSQSQSSSSGIIDPNSYKPASTDNPSGANKLKNMGNIIIGFLQIVGSILSVAVLAILGIKYMLGSVEEKAQYKKTMVPYVIGAIMVFGITNILGIASNVFGKLF